MWSFCCLLSCAWLLTFEIRRWTRLDQLNLCAESAAFRRLKPLGSRQRPHLPLRAASTDIPEKACGYAAADAFGKSQRERPSFVGR